MENDEKFGELIDRLDNLNGALQLPMPPAMHVTQMKIALPEVIAGLKEVYVGNYGENPWE